MKKIIFAAALTMCFATISFAQVSYGIKGGVSGYNFTGEAFDEADLKTKIGGFGGLFARIPVSENFSVQPEAVFSMEGARAEASFQEETIKESTNLNYINIPVMLQFNTTSGFYVEAGPQVGFLMTAKSKLEVNGESETEDVKEGFKSISFGVGFGAGYRLPMGFGITGRYNLGLSNIVDSDDADVKTSGFHIGLTYSFGGAAE